MRIVSLIPSATEIVYALGYGRNLVGRSHSCDYPDGVLDLPECTFPSFDIEGTSEEIDQRVVELKTNNEPLYFIEDEVLRSLDPDIILTQVQCDVCAVSFEDVKRLMISWSDFKGKVSSLTAMDLGGIYGDINRVGEVIGDRGKAEEVIWELRDQMGSLSRKAKGINYRPRVVCVEWIEPMMVAANWVPELLEMAGVEGLFGVAGEHSYRMGWERVVESDPDVLIFMVCGYSLQKTKEEMGVLVGQESWSSLKAVKNDQVFLVNGQNFFNRPAPSVKESLEILLEMIYRDDFRFKYEEKRWEKFVLEEIFV